MVTLPLTASVAVVLTGYGAALLWGFRPDKLTRDIVNLTGSPAYAGSLNMVVVMLWAASAAVLLSAARFVPDERVRERRFLYSFGWLLAYLGIDDALVLHDRVFKQQLLLPSTLTMAAYVAGTAAIVALHRRTILADPSWVVLAAAGVFLAGSVLMDERPPGQHGLPLGTLEYGEDGLKIVGLALVLRFALARAASEHRIDRPGSPST